MELKNVKAQIKDKPAFVEIPVYDKLDFWEGTTKKSDVKKETEATKAGKTVKNTTKTETTKTTKSAGTTVKFAVNSTHDTLQHTFRSNNKSKETIVKKKPVDTKKKVSEKDLKEKPMKITESSVLRASNIIRNNSVFDDDFNNIDYGFDNMDNMNFNVTNHIADLERYVNETESTPNDPNRIAKKKMLDELKSIMAEDPVERANSTLAFSLKAGKDIQDRDPLALMDDVGPL